MVKCGECAYGADVPGNPQHVKCNLQLPPWVEVREDYLAARRIVARQDGCSFGAYRDARTREIAEAREDAAAFIASHVGAGKPDRT